MNPLALRRLPRLVFATFVGITVTGIIAGFLATILTGWVPPRDTAGIFLPLYFGTLLGVLALTFIVSGNTLMHHFRTGTVERASNPVWFWCIVAVQLALAAILLVIGCWRWSAWHV
jgi:hypothetical protein